MTPNAERVTFTKKKKTAACPVPLAPLADTHAHLLSFWGKEVPETLVRAKAAGVDLLVTMLDPIADKRSVTDYSDWLVREILPMRDIPQIKYLAGVHPYGAPDYTDDIHAQVVAALDNPLCAGIGEIGLDYHMDYDDDIAPAPHSVQIDCMARQLEVAVRRNVPVELHLRHEDSDGERTSHVDAYNVLREVGVPQAGCVLHCFGEDRATMERFVGLGCYIAYGGAATFKRNDDVREAFAATPLDRILFETDCPYMAPETRWSTTVSIVPARMLRQSREQLGKMPANFFKNSSCVRDGAPLF